MQKLTLLLTFFICFSSFAATSKTSNVNVKQAEGTARIDEQNLDKLRTVNSAPERSNQKQKIDYNEHSYSGQNSQTYSKEDDQERMEDAHKYLEKQRAHEGSAKGSHSSRPDKVWPQER